MGRIMTSPWGNEDTQTLIDILGRYGVKATFFVVGQWAEKYPESVKALHEAGHEVMNHSDTHPHFPQLSAEQVIGELNACSDKVERVTGVRPTLVRLPYGDYDDASVSAVRSIGMTPIQWDVERPETDEKSIFPDIFSHNVPNMSHKVMKSDLLSQGFFTFHHLMIL